MTWLAFISSVISAVAWPITAIGIALLFRKKIAGIKFKKFKYAGVEAEVEEKLDEIEQKIAGLPEPGPTVYGRFTIDRIDNLTKIHSTNSEVFLAWMPAEDVILNLARRAEVWRQNMTPLEAARALYGQRIIDKKTYEAILALFDLRNIAVHSDADWVDVEHVERFKALAQKLVAILAEKIDELSRA